MFALDNPTRSYTWGSRTVIADLLGMERTHIPQAELWISAHPAAPSTIIGDTCGPDLLAGVSTNPHAFLGDDIRRMFGDRLPYLMKLLAVRAPLSLQVHPDRLQARSGFADENAQRLPSAAPDRTFKDPHHKPELVYALSEFHTLCGFRTAVRSRRLFGDLDRQRPRTKVFGQVARLLEDETCSAALERACRYVIDLPAEQRRAAIGSIAGCVSTERDPVCQGQLGTVVAVAAGFAADYPEDPAVLLTLFLNHVVLRPGDALGVEPRTPHAHLSGTAVEVTACSDNTIRCGLTTKHADPARFLDTVEFTAHADARIRVETPCDAEHIFSTGHPEFELSVLRLSSAAQIQWRRPKPRAVLVLAGSITMTDRLGTSTLGRGDSVFVPADSGTVTVRGEGFAVQATTGT